jgi:hypothetical protein
MDANGLVWGIGNSDPSERAASNVAWLGARSGVRSG